MQNTAAAGVAGSCISALRASWSRRSKIVVWCSRGPTSTTAPPATAGWSLRRIARGRAMDQRRAISAHLQQGQAGRRAQRAQDPEARDDRDLVPARALALL